MRMQDCANSKKRKMPCYLTRIHLTWPSSARILNRGWMLIHLTSGIQDCTVGAQPLCSQTQLKLSPTFPHLRRRQPTNPKDTLARLKRLANSNSVKTLRMLVGPKSTNDGHHRQPSAHTARFA